VRSTPEAAASLDRLMAEHAKPVLAYTTAILHDHHAAEDVVQETMLRAWQHRRLDEATGSVRGWLLTVARNLAFDRLRSAASRHERLAPEAVDVPARAESDRADPAAPDDLAEVVGQRAEVSELLAPLSPVHREVVAWTYLVGLDVRETARALGVPPGTVKSRRHYALSELRRQVLDRSA
jgi:RNA polymerase sigma-70 factor, ECF subfamily